MKNKKKKRGKGGKGVGDFMTELGSDTEVCFHEKNFSPSHVEREVRFLPLFSSI
jgi:hypothetical protein